MGCFVVFIVDFFQSGHETDNRTSVIGGILLSMKSDFVFVRLPSPKLNISLKLNNGSDLLRKGSKFGRVD